MSYLSKIQLLGLIWVLGIVCVLGQSNASQPHKPTLLVGRIFDQDTLPHVDLPMVTVTVPWKFKNNREFNRYSRLTYNVKKALPYARIASRKINDINDHLLLLRTDKERKTYLKQAEKAMFDEFEAPLKKLTFTQGRILINLIDRETGNTSYDLIKDYKGGFSAFVWQSVARVFGANLKDEYDPAGDDKMIEHIVIMIDNGML